MDSLSLLGYSAHIQNYMIRKLFDLITKIIYHYQTISFLQNSKQGSFEACVPASSTEPGNT